MTTILDGKKLSEKILSELKSEISTTNKLITLAIILVGNDPASLSYVRQKEKTGTKLGVNVKVYRYPTSISVRELKKQINDLNKDKKITGIIVQLPLPKQINTQDVLNTISPQKDVDVLSHKSIKTLQNKPNILPPTVAGIKILLDEYKIDYKNKNIAIVGYGQLVGKPASIIFTNEGANVSVIRSTTQNKADIIKQADIIISGVGKPGIITKNMVKKGVITIDAGSSIKNGKILGDVNPNVAEVSSYITPTPGGVGPMTVAVLFNNLIRLSNF